MKPRILAALAASLASNAAGVSAGQTEPVVVKIATMAPKDSAWYRVLQEMGEEWKIASKGNVVLKIYAGGVGGDDVDVVRKIRLGTINGGLLTLTGLEEIDHSVLALTIPMAFSDYDELDHVRGQMAPSLEKRFAEKGFVLLNWGDAGWVYFFSKTPVRTIEDMKKQKLFVWAGDDVDVLWKSAGFRPVPLPASEISTALQTGLITTAPATSQAAVLLQWYDHAKNMTDLKWAVLLGATVIDKRTWEKIPAELRPVLLASAQEAGRKLEVAVRAQGPRDLQAMQKRGLNVVHVDAAAEKEWRTAVEAMYPRLRGGLIPADSFDQALKLRDEYRTRPQNAASGK